MVGLVIDAGAIQTVPAATDDARETAKDLVLQERAHARTGGTGFAAKVGVVPFAAVSRAAHGLTAINRTVGQSGIDATLRGEIPVAAGVITAGVLQEAAAIKHSAIVVGSADALLNRGIEGAARILLAFERAQRGTVTVADARDALV